MPLVVAGLLPDVPASLGASGESLLSLSAHSGLPHCPLSQQGVPILFAYVLQINFCGYVLVGMEPCCTGPLFSSGRPRKDQKASRPGAARRQGKTSRIRAGCDRHFRGDNRTCSPAIHSLTCNACCTPADSSSAGHQEEMIALEDTDTHSYRRMGADRRC